MDISRRIFISSSLVSLGTLSLCGCHATPVTGRRRVLLVPEGQEITLGAKAFSDTISNEQPSSNPRLAQMVRRVGKRIAEVSGRSDFDWEFHLLENKTPNAFCLPGGKVAVYDGIMPICQDEAGLAVVMSHEVAHALARHGGERMSQNLLLDGAQTLAGKVVSEKFPTREEQLMRYYGLGSKYLVQLPYSRLQETEADHIGLMLMAKAGYDPKVAPAFWQRFGQSNSSQTMEWFSTHPSDERRATDLVQLMDEASSHYMGASEKFGRGERII